MDYEKKYREALKKAEAFYYSATTEPIAEREVLANIFPELKESGDEKIRKNIIIALKSQKDELGDFYKSHNTSESELVSWLEKQDETITEDFGEFINTLSKQFPEVSFAKLSRIAVRVKKWLEKQGEQNPAWSEEDENEVAILKAYIRSNDWSESHVDRAFGIVDELVKKLKSIKPQNTWKPSDEQMGALYTYIYNPQYFNSPDPRMELVESVYQDLKKLREE